MIFQKLLTNGKIILIVAIILCIAVLEHNTVSTKYDTDKMTNKTAFSYQLSYIKSLHYDVKIRINYETIDIIGDCNITIHIDRKMENLIVESVNFTIFKIVLYSNLSEKNYIPRYTFNTDLNKLIIDFTNTPKLLPPGKYNLIMAYMRYINDDKKHFFQSLYLNNKLDNMLEATGIDVMTARQLFPIVCSTFLCRDEENLKATFKISIKHHKNYTALSNMHVKSKENDKHMMWTHFDESPIMSFNHLIVVITTFINISATANVTFWGRENATHYLHLAKCVVQYVSSFLEYESNITQKMDYIVFWDMKHNISQTEGLIFQREADIIYDEDLNSVGLKIRIAYLITHQIISYRYTDAVLWSKTGFLTLLATYTLHKIDAIYDVMNLFIAETQRESFLFSISTIFKTYNNTLNITEKNLVFSYALNYTKSFGMWQTLYQIIPANVFWIGIRTYIDQQYNKTNAVNNDDLWNIMQTVLHTYLDNSTVFIVKELISTWIAANYYPVLYVIRDVNTNWITFSYLTPDNIDKDIQYHPIFVTYTTKSIMNFQEIFGNKSFWLSPSEKRYEMLEANDWIIVNLQQTGYYRVFYDTITWFKLSQYMNSTKYLNIHVLNRAQIIDDAFYFAMHGYFNYNMFWNVSAFLSQDTNYVAWYPMLKIFEYIVLKVSINDARDIRKHMETLLSGILQKLGYIEKQYESDLTQCLREEVVKWACIIGNKECRTMANTQMGIDLMNLENNIQLEWKQWIYCNGLKIANRGRWLRVRQRWILTSDNKLLEYLICTEDPNIIILYLEMLMNFLELSNTTRVNIFLLIIAKHIKHDQIYNFVLKNFDTYILSFTSNKQIVKVAILIIIISHQKDVWKLEKVLEFAKTNLEEMRLIDAVGKKNKERRLQVRKQVRNYGIGLSLFP